MTSTLPPLFFKGIELFNQEQFYDCHEVLEVVWRDQVDPEKQLTQGIIQVAVALYHCRRDNYVGAEKLLLRGLERIRRSLAIASPIDVAALLSDVEKALYSVQSKCRPNNFAIIIKG